MRTYDEIRDDIQRATLASDNAALRFLAQEMSTLGTPDATAATLSTLGHMYRNTGQYARALEHYRRALQVFSELGDRGGAARVISNMGIVYGISGDYPQALEHFRSALRVHEELGDRIGVARVTGNMGTVFERTGDYPQALEHYRRAQQVHEEQGDRAAAAAFTGNMGIVYQNTGDYPRALEYFGRALRVHEELDGRAGAAQVIGNIGVVYVSTGDYAQALEYYQRALQMHEDRGDRAGAAHITASIGGVYLATREYPKALEYYRRSLKVHEELGDRADIALVTGNMITALLEMNRSEEAEGLLQKQSSMVMDDPATQAGHFSNLALLAEKREDLNAAWENLLHALQIVRESNVRSAAAQYHQRLRNLAQKRNDFAGYIEHNNEYQRITEEIRGQESTRKLAMIEAEKRIEAERAEKEKHKTLLHNTLPPAIADRVLRGETVNDSHDMAAVMFMDMVGFTTMSSAMDPGDVVSLLSQIFTTCDAIMAKHGMMKIKTIGDSYMAIAISNTEDHKPKTTQTMNSAVSNAARAAVQVLTMLSEQHPQIKVRIGLHCGPVTAGVIGTERLQYDVWGDTVNVASRMESHGEPGRIHVSESFALALDPRLRGDDDEDCRDDEEDGGHDGGSRTAHRPPHTDNDSLTPDSLTLLKRGEIVVKGKGLMTTYWLEGA